MAYPTISAPYGLKPINLIGGQVFAGATRQLVIASAYGTSIFYGDVVKVVAGGTIEKDTGTTTATPVGVFLGCSYVNAQGQVIFSQYYPANTTGVVQAFVIDDDRTVFQAQSAGSVTQAALGANLYLNAAQSTSTGSTTTGNSTSALVAGSSAQTAAAAFRVVGFVNSTTSQVGDDYTDVLIKFNPGFHSYTVALGI